MAQQPEIFDKIQTLLSSTSAKQATKEIERLDGEIRAMQEDQAKWRTLLGLINQLGEAEASANGTGAEERPTLRQAIFGVFETKPLGTAMKLKSINQQLQQAGLLSGSKTDTHRLQMMASNMVKRNQLERPRQGYYRLPLGPHASDGEGAKGTDI